MACSEHSAPLVSPLVAGTETSAPQHPHYPLQRSWMFWGHLPCYDGNYGGSRRSWHPNGIRSVKDFWCHFNNLPLPSAVFDAAQRARGKAHTNRSDALEGVSFFSDGITPDWEHPANATGATITFKGSIPHARMDRVWLMTLLSLVGETAPHSERIKGVRVMERTPFSRLEVWVDEEGTKCSDEIAAWVRNSIIARESPVEITTFSTPHKQAESDPPSRAATATTAKRSRRGWGERGAGGKGTVARGRKRG